MPPHVRLFFKIDFLLAHNEELRLHAAVSRQTAFISDPDHRGLDNACTL